MKVFNYISSLVTFQLPTLRTGVTLLPCQSTVHAKKPFAILDWNLNNGYAVIDKPCSIASHATVDNGVENALYQVQQQL